MRAVSAAADLALLSTRVPAALLGEDEDVDTMFSILPEFLRRAPIALLWKHAVQEIGGEFACPALP
jgi:hypothetical protein